MRLGWVIDSLHRRLIDEFPALAADQALDDLVAADGWPHPALVIEGSRRDWKLLLRMCDERLLVAKGPQRARLEEVRGKLAMAIRLAEDAREVVERRRAREAKAARSRKRRRRR